MHRASMLQAFVASALISVAVPAVSRGQANCGAGTVNSGAGPITDVLFVNGRTGQVNLSAGEPVTVAMAATPAGPATNAQYALWVWLSCAATPRNLVVSGQLLGCTVNPTPFEPGFAPQALRCLRGGLGSQYCGSVRELNGAPARAPFSLTRVQGLGQPGTYTLQGIIEDAGSANTLGFSVTNAVTVRVGDLESPPEPSRVAPSACGSSGVSPAASEAPSVYLHSGELHLSAVDLRIPGRGLDFVWARKYRSRSGPSTAPGNGWDFSYDIRIVREGQNIRLFDGNTRSDLYTARPDGTYTRREQFHEGRFNPDGTFALTFEDTGRWILRALDGSAAQGKIQSIVDRNGNVVSFAYNGIGRLVTITDTLGRPITVAYTTEGRVATVTDFAQRRVTYTYYTAGALGGSPGDLKTVTTPAVIGTPTGNDFPAGKTTVYTYSRNFADDRLNHNLLTITDPKGQLIVTNVYASTQNCRDRDFDRVVSQTWGGASDTIQIVYAAQTPSPANGQAIAKAIVNDRVGNVAECFFDARNRCVMKREFTGRALNNQPTTDSQNRPVGRLRPDDPAYFETRYEYNADSLVTRITHPNGNVSQNVYELDLNPGAPWRARGNLRERLRLPGTHNPIGDQTSLLELFEDDTGAGGCCGTNFVTRQTDARGNATVHTYDALGNRTRTVHRIPTIIDDFEYNSFGQMTAHVWPGNGSGVRRRDELTYYTPADGAQNGYPRSKIIDASGARLTTTYSYDSVGNVVQEVDPRNGDTTYVRNSLDQVVRQTSRQTASGSGIRYERDFFYDANDNLVRVDVQNKNDQGVLQPNTHFTTTHTHEILNRVVCTTQEVDVGQNVVTEYVYDGNRNRTVERRGATVCGGTPAVVVSTSYDERDLVHRVIRAPGTPSQSTTQVDYDGNGSVRARREGLESSPRVTSFAYDSYDRAFSVTDPMGNVTEYHYDANGNVGGDQVPGIPNLFGERLRGELNDVPGSAGNVRLSQSNYRYDAMNRVVRTDVNHFNPENQSPIGDGLSTTVTEYTDTSQVRRVVDDNGHATLYLYDSMLQLQQIVDPLNNTASYTYDANRNLLSVTQVERSGAGGPALTFTTRYSYDGLDRLVRTVDNRNNTVDYAYDSRGNNTRMVDAARVNSPGDPGNVVLYVYDGLDRVRSTTYVLTADGTGSGTPLGQLVETRSYDPASRLVEEADDNGHRTRYVYDGLNRILRTTYEDSKFESYQYDVHDNVVERIDANGSRTTNTYDLLDGVTLRSVSTAFPAAPSTSFESLRYDGESRNVSAENDGSLVTRSHDSMGNVTRETINGDTTFFQYDGVGNETRVTYPSGTVIVKTYDALNRLLTVTEQGVGNAATFVYAGPDRIERTNYGNGTRCVFSYDGATGVPNPPGDFGVKQLIGTTHSVIATGEIIDARTYGWDHMGNKTLRSDVRPGGPMLSHAYQYDSVYRLTRTLVTDGFQQLIRDTQYDLDGAGNRRTVFGGPDSGSYFMDPTQPESADFQLNQYTFAPNGSRSYDSNGNVLHGSGSFVYDYRDRLVQAQDFSTGAIVTYAYDVFGRPVRRTTDLFGVQETTRFAYDEWREIEELDETGAPRASAIHGTHDDEVIVARRNGNRYFHHADDLGNVVAVTDPNGVVVERYEYGDFGRPEYFDGSGNSLSGSAIGNPWLFNGRRFDVETGQYWARTRRFDPRDGRFTSRDTIGAFGDPSAHGNDRTYTGNNPWSRLDPTGESSSLSSPSPKSCSSADLGFVSQDLAEALRMAREADNYVRRMWTWERPFDVRLLMWFGPYHHSRFQVQRDTLSAIRSRLENGPFIFDCNRSDPSCGFARAEARSHDDSTTKDDEILLCQAFFDAYGLGGSSARWAQGGILFHEVSHLSAHTTDDAYPFTECLSLAFSNPDRAARNANNYLYFAMSGIPGSHSGFSISTLTNLQRTLQMTARLAVAETRYQLGRARNFVHRSVRKALRWFERQRHGHRHRRGWWPF